MKDMYLMEPYYLKYLKFVSLENVCFLRLPALIS